MEQKRKIKASEILEMFKQGMSREKINEEMGLNPAERKFLWSNPIFKGVKPSKFGVFIDLEDDTQEENSEVKSPELVEQL